MPELPEVETIVRQLNQKVLHKKISKVEVHCAKVVDRRIKNLSSVNIARIWRRAKYIVMELENGSAILTHLGMTGHFHYVDRTRISNNYQKYLAAKFLFSDGSFLTHNSIRKFGRMKLISQKNLPKFLEKLGPEPLEESFTLTQFQKIVTERSTANIKTMLLNQKALAGIGNIYAQEALYYAGISPLRTAGSLTETEVQDLYTHLRRILQRAIEYQGTTVDNYSNLEGSGGFQNYLAVYGKEKCERGHELHKIIVGGRGTSYCPECQR